MKQNLLQRFLSTILLLAISVLSWAYDFESNGIYYNINADGASVTVTYKITYYNSYSGSISIPSQVIYGSTTYIVTSIGDYAFCSCTGLTSVTIPNSVTSIGSLAFKDCSGLTFVHIDDLAAWCNIRFAGSVSNPLDYAKHLYLNGEEVKDLVIPNSVTSIGGYAFCGCIGLLSVTLPNNVTNIGIDAFYGCSDLTSVTLNSHSIVSASRTSDTSMKSIFGEQVSNYVIGNNVSAIGNNAFYGCTNLTSISIPNSVTSIGIDAFYGCSDLTSVTLNSHSIVSASRTSDTSMKSIFGEQVSNYVIGNNVSAIGNKAFYGCTNLTSIAIPNSVTSIGSGAFSGTAWYDNLPDGLVYAGKVAYKYKGIMPSETNITIDDGTLGITASAFKDCAGLTSVKIPSSLTSIGNYAFYGCSSLTSVTIPNSLTSIGNYAFYGCSSLTSVTIPESVTNIGGSAFYNCTDLTSVILNTNEFVSRTYTSSNNLTTIFGSQVTEYILGNNVTGIGSFSFYNCSNLKSITIPNSVTSIGKYAFSDCSNLESVTFGTGLLTIGSKVFENYTPAKVIWLTNSPPNGYSNAAGTINYVANDQYTSLSNKKVYPFLSSMFEVGGVKYVPVSPSERTCDAIDCLYNAGAENVIIGDKVSYKGINMSVGSVNDYTFYRNTHIIELNLNCNGYIGNNSFYGCISLANVNLGESITSIGNYAFSDCSSLENIVIPDAVTSLGSCSFQNCSNLKSIEMGSGVKTILTYAFANCTALPVIIIPKSVTSISNYVFRGCNSLRTVIMDEQKSELSLGSNGNSPLFSSCPLDSVYIGRNIIYQTSSNYGYSPFYRNTSLRSIEITDGETEISDNEFYGCTNLQNVKIGNGVTKIGKWAFSGCSSIDYFSFGSSVEEIGQEAFSDCTAMTRLISHAPTPPTCGSQALDDINKWECTLSVPSGCIGYYQQANQWKEFFFVDDDADAPVYLVGDANGNGEVEIGDVTSVLTLMATPEATSYDNKAADANGNGVIEIGDVTTILTIMAGGN